MKTLISEFCVEFSEALFPLAESLGDAVSQIAEIGEESVASLGSSFADVRHRVESLVNKVQGQEAYVLLFGPLKSGKSTLLNAISAGYVSEVTSLPAYPCMVNLKYGEKPSYSVIRYSGKKEPVDSPEALKALLEQSHRTLSDRVRAIEDFGEEFDPLVHLPSAIRRVQVELPVENLKESGTVLVDTPGLYSKMKFGYDTMTREFRDSAACAVFVVKTDNLFLEQVFDDFNDLLDQFSRVFVVVNIDSGKQDLCPDGTLRPSLESSDPDQIVKSFEALTMSAPLRCAAESGRLHIYPIDLCGAAARRMGTGGQLAEPGGEEPDRFDKFLGDLLEYLNSVDYLREFMADTVRQSESLCREIVTQCESEPATAIRRGQAEIRRRLDVVSQKHASANRVRNLDWETRFKELQQERRTERTAILNESRATFAEQSAEVIDAWFIRDESLATLRDHRVIPLIQELVRSYRDKAVNLLEAVGGKPVFGLSLSTDEEADVQAVNIGLDAMSSEILRELPVPDNDELAIQLSLDRIPIRRSWVDKLLLRSMATLRRKLIGAADTLEASVSPRVKQRRLGPEARTVLMDLAERELSRHLNRAEEEMGEGRMKMFVNSSVNRIETLLTERERQLIREKNELTSTSEKLDRLDATFSSLADVADSVLKGVGLLEQRHRPKVQNLVAIDEVLGTAKVPTPGDNQASDISSDDRRGAVPDSGAEQSANDSQSRSPKPANQSTPLAGDRPRLSNPETSGQSD